MAGTRLDRAAFLLAASQAAFTDDATPLTLIHPAGFTVTFAAPELFARWQAITSTATATRADCNAFAVWVAQQIAATAVAFLARQPQW